MVYCNNKQNVLVYEENDDLYESLVGFASV